MPVDQYLKGDVIAYVTVFKEILVDGAQIRLHLHDASRAQGILSMFLSRHNRQKCLITTLPQHLLKADGKHVLNTLESANNCHLLVLHSIHH